MGFARIPLVGITELPLFNGLIPVNFVLRYRWTALFSSWAVFVATRCQAVENVNYRVHRLATVATQLAKWRCPACHRNLFPAGQGRGLVSASALRIEACRIRTGWIRASWIGGSADWIAGKGTRRICLLERSKPRTRLRSW